MSREPEFRISQMSDGYWLTEVSVNGPFVPFGGAQPSERAAHRSARQWLKRYRKRMQEPPVRPLRRYTLKAEEIES